MRSHWRWDRKRIISAAVGATLVIGVASAVAALSGRGSKELPAVQSMTAQPVPTIARPCALSHLGVTFGYTGLGAGHEWGVLLLRNQGPAPCVLRDSIVVAAVDQDGRPLPAKGPLVSRPAVPPLVLAASSARATTAVPASVESVGLLITGTYRHRSGACPPSYTETPAAWRLTLTGQATTVRNRAPRSALQRLSACEGDFGINDQTAGRSLPISPAPN
jgi:hypothetical protein